VATRQYVAPSGAIINETGSRQAVLPSGAVLNETASSPPASVTGTASGALRKLSGSASGAFEASGISGDAAGSFAKPTGSADGTVTAPSGATTLTIDDFNCGSQSYSDGFIINRAPGANNRDVTFTGTYTGAPDILQVKLTDFTSGATVQDWTSLSSVTASGGIWSGILNVPVYNGWLKAQVQDAGNATASSTTTKRFSVGVNVLMIGQSNMAKAIQSGTFAITGTADDLARVYAHSGWHKVFVSSPGIASWDGGTVSDNTIRLANSLRAALNCPVGLLLFPVPATTIKQWLTAANGGFADDNVSNVWFNSGANGGAVGGSGGATSSTDLAGVNSSLLYGHDFEAAVWQQGEQEGTGSGGSATYGTSLAALRNQLLAVNGRTATQFKFLVVPLGTEVTTDAQTSVSGHDASMQAVRQAHLQYIADHAAGGVYYGGTALDATHSPSGSPAGDAIHWAGVDATHAMKRYTQALLKAFGTAANGTGPKLASASRSGTTVTVTVTHDGGTALKDSSGSTSGTGLKGFRYLVDGTPVTVSDVAISAANKLTLTLAADPGDGHTETLDYGANANPLGYSYVTGSEVTSANSVYDDFIPANSTAYADSIGTPLQPSLGALTVSTGGSFTGTASGTLGKPTGSASGAVVAFIGAGSGSLGRLSGSAEGTFTPLDPSLIWRPVPPAGGVWTPA
jgi:hypothetical protein